jgi:hypothetical protein
MSSAMAALAEKGENTFDSASCLQTFSDALAL